MKKLATYLKSNEFKKLVSSWDWRYNLYDENGVDLETIYELSDDEVFDEVIQKYEVVRVDDNWEFNDGDGEMWLVPNIIVRKMKIRK